MKVYHRGQLIKIHATGRSASRSTDREDLPAEKTIYALPDITRLAALCAGHGCAPSTG